MIFFVITQPHFCQNFTVCKGPCYSCTKLYVITLKHPQHIGIFLKEILKLHSTKACHIGNPQTNPMTFMCTAEYSIPCTIATADKNTSHYAISFHWSQWCSLFHLSAKNAINPKNYTHSLQLVAFCYGKWTELSLSFRPVNERQRYKVMPSLISWAQT